jgi:hypothetical protein
MAVPYLYLPFTASFFSFGIGFVLIVLLEAWILARRENLQFRRSVWLVTVANLHSTVAGIVFSIALTALPSMLNFPMSGGNWIFLPLAIVIWLSLGDGTAKCLKDLTKLWSGNSLIWGLVWVIILFAEFFFIGLVNTTNNKVLKLLVTAIYFSVGFAMSIVVEGAYLSRSLPEKSATLGKTLLIANVRSYAYIAIPITIAMLRFRN